MKRVGFANKSSNNTTCTCVYGLAFNNVLFTGGITETLLNAFGKERFTRKCLMDKVSEKEFVTLGATKVGFYKH